MEILLEKSIFLKNPPFQVRSKVIETLTVDNPKYAENARLGRWNKSTPKKLTFYSEENGVLIVPRGFMRNVIDICRNCNVEYFLKDERRVLKEINFSFSGKLKDYQLEAVSQMLKKDFGTLNAPTGSGKTVMALYMIGKRKQPALIVVPTKDLAFQWIERIEQFLGIEKDMIGFIGGGKCKIGNEITVSMVQSLYKRVDEVSPKIGHIIVDECHRAPARTFSEAISGFDCKFMTGLSATPYRRDKLSKLIFFNIGHIIHSVDSSVLREKGNILSVEPVYRITSFSTLLNPSTDYSKVLKELVNDKDRNHLIAKDVACESESGNGVCLVLSDRKAHCENISIILKLKYGMESAVLTGDTESERRKEIVREISEGKVKILIATGQLIGEGFDCKDLSTLFLSTPIKFSGRLLQYLGRVLRPSENKIKAKVYDYVDELVGPLKSSAEARKRYYM